MSRRLPKFEVGALYHVYDRGAAKTRIFAEPENYRYLLRWLAHYSREFNVPILAYCLMPNHYHFLLQESSGNGIAQLVQRLFNRYTKAFNRRYGRSGTLLEGPYRAIRVDDQVYLLHLVQYIHLNPVMAGLVRHPGDWPFSDFNQWAVRAKPVLGDHRLRRELFPEGSEYVRFVAEYFASGKAKPYQVKQVRKVILKYRLLGGDDDPEI